VKDPCTKAVFESAPATEREWLAVTFDVDELRVRRQNEEKWLEVRDASWRPDALLAVDLLAWSSSRRVLTDSLIIPWGEIERIDRPRGSRAGLGAGVGAFVGLGVGLGIAYLDADDCEFCGFGYLVIPLITMPIGAVTGAVIGSTQNGWAPIFCAPPGGNSAPPDKVRE
jgi:hypothetical protein